MSGGKDGQTLYHRILPPTARGLTSKTAVKWHLKVKDIDTMLFLPKRTQSASRSHITVSLQKTSSIHEHIQQILGSHEINGHHAHF